MPSDQPSLESLQRWMQAVIMHPGGVVHGMTSEAACQQIDLNSSDVESIIPRSQAMSGIKRLEIYSRAYFARLLECLRAEFPITAAAVGEDLFDEFALSYLQAYPSQSYTLGQLADRFASYLRETCPRDTSDRDAWPAFLIDLAVLERTFGDVFDGPGVENRSLLDAAQLLAIPPERMPDVRLAVMPCLRLLALDYPVHRYYRAIKHKEDALPPAPEPTYLAVTRQDYTVRHYELSPVQYTLLSAILGGAPLGHAVTKAAEAAGPDTQDMARDLQDWFRRWSSEGFFLTVELPEHVEPAVRRGQP